MSEAANLEQPATQAIIPRTMSTALGARGGNLSAPEKAAVIISLLGAENAGPIVEKIEDRQLRAFMSALENLQQIPRDSMLSVVADFITELQGRRGGFKGGRDAAKELAKSMFPEERVTRLFGAPPPPPKPKTTADVVWTTINEREVADVVKYLQTQKSAVISIILSQLSPDKAGEILSELPEDISIQCVAAMPRAALADGRTVDAIAELVQLEFLSDDQEDNDGDSIAFVGEVLGILPRDRRDKMLKTLEETNPEQAALVKQSMLTFEDLKTKLPVTAISMIFRDFDQVKLIRMLKAGAEQAPDVIEFFFGNITQRMAAQYQEQVEDLKVMSQKQGDNAISSLMAFISKLEKEGRIKLIKPDEDEA